MTTAPIAVPTIGLVSVNVGRVGYLGDRRGSMVESGIVKRAVTETSVRVSLTNLAGDEQADIRVHGGPDKAVYAYPSEHLAWWTSELKPERRFGPGSFGENLTVAGWNEEMVLIGDIWQWGSALLEVCQPRYPCYKLSMATGKSKVGKLMVATGRTGWYLRVLEEGDVPVCGPVLLSDRSTRQVSVHDAHRARLPGADPMLLRKVFSEERLAGGLRAEIEHQLQVATRRCDSTNADRLALE